MRIIWNSFCSWTHFTELCSSSAYYFVFCSLTKYITIENIYMCCSHICLICGSKINKTNTVKNKQCNKVCVSTQAKKGLNQMKQSLKSSRFFNTSPFDWNVFNMHTTEYKHCSVSPTLLCLCTDSRVHRKYNKQTINKLLSSWKKRKRPQSLFVFCTTVQTQHMLVIRKMGS